MIRRRDRVKALEREAVELRGLIQQTNSDLAQLRDVLAYIANSPPGDDEAPGAWARRLAQHARKALA